MNNNKKENLLKLEYVWIDGAKPWGLRSKIKVARVSDETLNEMLTENSPADLPMWGFDGSSTNQAVGDDSDCILNDGLWSYFRDKDHITNHATGFVTPKLKMKLEKYGLY